MLPQIQKFQITASTTLTNNLRLARNKVLQHQNIVNILLFKHKISLGTYFHLVENDL